MKIILLIITIILFSTCVNAQDCILYKQHDTLIVNGDCINIINLNGRHYRVSTILGKSIEEAFLDSLFKHVTITNDTFYIKIDTSGNKITHFITHN